MIQACSSDARIQRWYWVQIYKIKNILWFGQWKYDKQQPIYRQWM